MKFDPDLIGRIYEAAALPERWAAVLQEVAANVGAIGGVLITYSPTHASSIASTAFERHFADYVAQGWVDDHTLVEPLMTDLHPGFRAQTDFLTPEEIAQLPVHKEFLAPRGLSPGNGTVLQGVRDDALQVAFHGFATHAAAAEAVGQLDELRAMFGRALSLSSQLQSRADAQAVAALELAGVPAAVITREGRLRAANDRFTTRLGAAMDTRAGRVRFADRILQARLAEALATLDRSEGIRSIAVAARGDTAAFALHLLPLRWDARDVFEADGILILLAEPANASVPGADLLRLLFDLTLAEARLTRLLVEGSALAQAARALRITEATARTHLRRVFAKTGVQRQPELVRLLLGLGAPQPVVRT